MNTLNKIRIMAVAILCFGIVVAYASQVSSEKLLAETASKNIATLIAMQSN